MKQRKNSGTLKFRRLISMILAVATVAVFSVTAYATTNWKTGCFAGGTSWTTTHYVYAEAQKHQSKGKTWYTAKTPKLSIYSYKGNNKEQKGTTMYVQIARREGSKWNWWYDYSYNDGQTETLKLLSGNANKKYTSAKAVRDNNKWMIRIRRYSKNTDVKFWAMKAVNGTF